MVIRVAEAAELVRVALLSWRREESFRTREETVARRAGLQDWVANEEEREGGSVGVEEMEGEMAVLVAWVGSAVRVGCAAALVAPVEPGVQTVKGVGLLRPGQRAQSQTQ